MATADIEEHLSERDWVNTLFSKQYCGQLLIKLVKIDDVVEKFIDSKTISVAEIKSLRSKKVADRKIRYLLTIITDHCKRNDFQAFQTFIDILGDTTNVDIAQQLSLIYNERVHSFVIQSRLTKEKALVINFQTETSRLQEILKEKEIYFKDLTDEKKQLVDNYRKAADDKDETFRKEKLSLEKQIKIKDEDLLIAKKKMGELTRDKNDLEKRVNLKSNDIRKQEKEIVEKERVVCEAIAESNRLHLKIDTLQQHSKAMVENKEEMSKKIKILEDEIAEKENTIMNLRKSKPMTREELEEFRNITKDQEKKLDDLNKKFDAVTKAQMASAKQQNEKIDALTKAQMASAKQQNEKIDVLTTTQMELAKQQNEKFDALTKAQMASAKQQNEKIDALTTTQMELAKQQNENFDALTKAQMASAKQQNENFDVLSDKFTRVLNLLEKK